MISWTVDTKQPLPIQGPFYDLAGYLFKPALKRLVKHKKVNSKEQNVNEPSLCGFASIYMCCCSWHKRKKPLFRCMTPCFAKVINYIPTFAHCVPLHAEQTTEPE